MFKQTFYFIFGYFIGRNCLMHEIAALMSKVRDSQRIYIFYSKTIMFNHYKYKLSDLLL